MRGGQDTKGEKKYIRIVALALFKDAGFVVAGHVLYLKFHERRERERGKTKRTHSQPISS